VLSGMKKNSTHPRDSAQSVSTALSREIEATLNKQMLGIRQQKSKILQDIDDIHRQMRQRTYILKPSSASAHVCV